MQTLNTTIKTNVTLVLLGALLSSFNSAWALSDMQLQEKALKARESMRHGDMDHAEHNNNAVPETMGFRGVFYGYLPCSEKDCDGLKMTLSLKQKNNYLLVYQYAKASSREYYEKGKYQWDDVSHTLTLTPNGKPEKRLFTIKDESELVQINSNGTTMPGDQDDYTLSRSDKGKTRQVHIH